MKLALPLLRESFIVAVLSKLCLIKQFLGQNWVHSSLILPGDPVLHYNVGNASESGCSEEAPLLSDQCGFDVTKLRSLRASSA